MWGQYRSTDHDLILPVFQVHVIAQINLLIYAKTTNKFQSVNNQWQKWNFIASVTLTHSKTLKIKVCKTVMLKVLCDVKQGL